MAEIPVERKSAFPWWIAILAAIIVAALAWWWIADDKEVGEPLAPPAATGETAGTPGGPLTTIEAIFTSADPTTLVGRQVALTSVPVQAVPGDRIFMVGPAADRAVMVLLDETPTPGTPVEGRVEVNAGQIVSLTGVVRAASDLGNNPAAAAAMPSGQDIYILTDSVQVVEPSAAGQPQAGSNAAAQSGADAARSSSAAGVNASQPDLAAVRTEVEELQRGRNGSAPGLRDPRVDGPASFAVLDRNRDGRLSPAEFAIYDLENVRPTVKGKKNDEMRPFVSNEALNMSITDFRKLDGNGDWFLTSAEFAARR